MVKSVEGIYRNGKVELMEPRARAMMLVIIAKGVSKNPSHRVGLPTCAEATRQ
jgi:hypothetical protein